MAWTTPPTFVDGNVLSAAQLNVLSSDIEHLYGAQQGVNIPFAALYSNGITLDGNNNGWYLLHLHRYLHFRARIIDFSATLFRVMNGTTTWFSDATTRNGPYTYNGYIDLNPFGLTVGSLYKVHVDFTVAAFAKCAVDYLLQSDQTTL